MHITSVELENIKSHRDSGFVFEPGKIAITGENGAGKTSIIEAIAWALFDSLEYKKEEFVRRGARAGIVRVTFQSGLDERRYTVLRDTDTAYYVFDPIFGARFAKLPDRLADKKEEVARFVRQHLGIEPGTDLRALFRQAIGVPQGTFTSIFLEGAAERKSAFDKLLKVEEYRQGAEKLRETARYVENKIVDARLQIAKIEAEIGRSESAENEFTIVSDQVAKLTNEIESLETDIAEKRTRVADLELKEKELLALKTAADRLRFEKERAGFLFDQKASELKSANESAEVIERVRADSQRHIEILGRLTELERERSERDRLRKELSGIEAAIVNVSADRKGIQRAMESAVKAHQEIEVLRPRVKEQKALEKEIQHLRERYGQLRSLEERLVAVNLDLERLREAYRDQQSKVKEVELNAAAAGSLADLERKGSDVVLRIAALKAGLDRDQKFQTEIQNGLCPILSEKCLNLKPGQTLEGFINTQFSELRGKIRSLEAEKARIDSGLKAARDAEKSMAKLESMRARIDELTSEGKKLRAEKDALEKRIEGSVEIQTQLARTDQELKGLDNPEARIKILETEAARGSDLRREMSEIEKNLERLESERRLLVERLDEFRDLDLSWQKAISTRDETAEAHRSFVQNERSAAAVSELTKAFTASEKAFAEISVEFEQAEDAARRSANGYAADEHRSIRELLQDSERRSAAAKAAMTAAANRRQQLAAELKHFAEIRETMKAELGEKEKLEKVAEMTAFIRDILKESGPRVARNYVFLVSVEANQMFGEITGRVDRMLKWNDDYGVSIEEDGFERPFVSLSGGEQMAAALSIRLAILKQLSDIRIAFFDEPTTNMDAERRENLAQQISQIKNFDQLFVISHDDTFEGYVDEVIHVGERGVS